jgi:hypothetical protein
MPLLVRLEYFFKRVLIATDQHQIGSAFGEYIRNEATQTASRAGDQRCSVFELHVNALAA